MHLLIYLPSMNSETSFMKMFTFTFSHLADTFLQTELQMRTTEAIKPTLPYHLSLH